MVAAAIDVVSLDRAKQELRLGGDTKESRAAFTAHDFLLKVHIEAAVSFVEKKTGLRLVDKQFVEFFRAPEGDDSPLVLEDVGRVKSIDRIRYWPDSADLSGEPDEVEVIASDSLRLVNRQAGRNYHPLVYPPAGGWPTNRLSGSPIEVQYTRGAKSSTVDEVTTVEIEPALIAAVVLCVRQLYDGYSEIRPTAAIFALIDPWREL